MGLIFGILVGIIPLTIHQLKEVQRRDSIDRNLPVFLLALLSTSLFAEYNNCEFKKPHYSEICERVVKNGVPVHDANLFLLSAKTEKMDERSFKLFHPSKIKTHRANEKKANNVLQ